MNQKYYKSSNALAENYQDVFAGFVANKTNKFSSQLDTAANVDLLQECANNTALLAINSKKLRVHNSPV